MGPNNLSQLPSGHPGPEYMADCGGQDADVGRMILIYRWLRFYQHDTHRLKISGDETDMVDFAYDSGTNGSLDRDPAAPGCCSPVGNYRTSELDRTENTEMEKQVRELEK